MKDPSSSKRITILIVEDDPHSQLYFTKLLSGMYDTAAAASAAEAWELFRCGLKRPLPPCPLLQ
ncbi:MAG: hypothetical protein MUE37_05750 [Bacteroidales bacterium]|nr:hypothetical protein [Bacteroidales bacterium]